MIPEIGGLATFIVSRTQKFSTTDYTYVAEESWSDSAMEGYVYQETLLQVSGEYENWAICRRLFPHVKAALSQQPGSQESLREWATLLYKGAWYASQSGILADARDMALKSRKQRVRLLGEEHEDALDSTAILARAWSLEGRWEKAERLEVQVMEIREKKFGEDHPSTITSTASLALTFWNQGRWEEAE